MKNKKVKVSHEGFVLEVELLPHSKKEQKKTGRKYYFSCLLYKVRGRFEIIAQTTYFPSIKDNASFLAYTKSLDILEALYEDAEFEVVGLLAAEEQEPKVV
ncbi:hypothetical protein ACHHV8_11075 [Paenibacillus sp. TAB 01]|uniref:hypothetical protein n=1 Tax=Paenibacillus sp. TAB 01 TaxID=3368988 RepID=UPI003750AF79